MDYFDLLKRAWTITWRHKALWVLGLFAGAASGGSGGGGGSNYSTSSQDFSGNGGQAFTQMERWVTDNVALIAVVAGALVIFFLAMWVLSVAAQGGIAHGTNEAAEGRTPSLGASWSVGFSKWGRTFMIQFTLGLPLLLVAMLMGGVLVASGLVGASGGEAAAGVGICLFFPILFVVILGAAFIIGILLPMAIRYGVLLDVTFGQAIKRAWDDLWGKKGLFVFWLVMLLPGIAYGIGLTVIAIPLAIPLVFLFIAEQYIMAIALTVLMVLVLMLPGAIYGTFANAAWTLFFRRVAGLDPGAPSSVPAYEGPLPGGDAPTYAPPAPPVTPDAGYAPPAPPVTQDAAYMSPAPPAYVPGGVSGEGEGLPVAPEDVESAVEESLHSDA